MPMTALLNLTNLTLWERIKCELTLQKCGCTKGFSNDSIPLQSEKGKVNEHNVEVLSTVSTLAAALSGTVVPGNCCEGIRPVHSLNHSDFRSKGLKQD